MSRPPRPDAVTTPPAGTTVSSTSTPPGSSHHGRYLPGVVLAERYRIVDRIGRGGMGEVYRADDLKLDQVVALKFLPESVEHDADRLARLLGEVRLARQVSHPNLCRVYDVDEVDGRHFLTMEYVDGEDLESLLRRIGHLPREKALELARQICAGLAAAHDQRVLHRDLKPANVMIDGRGRARITDFGLAIAADQASGREVFAGTPAYMAPEQWAGREVTVQSDLYALGLVLYELFTGRRAFEGTTSRELALEHSEVAPRPPSSFVDGFDPVVERAILRCLEKDPQARPSSALAVAAALPGGDPLAAALAAGETPSPALVAASGGEGRLSRRTALLLAGGLVVLVAAIVAISPYSTDLGLAAPPRSPVLLADQAQKILAGAGYRDPPADAANAFRRDYGPLLFASQRGSSPDWRRDYRRWGAPLLFHYRQSPRPMVPSNDDGQVGGQDPPFVISGMARVTLNGDGLLREMAVVPPEVDSTWTAGRRTPDAAWAQLFAAAGLDTASFRETAPRWIAEVGFDERREWVGAAPWDSAIALRVSGQGWNGRPVSYRVIGPWTRPLRMVDDRVTTRRRIGNLLFGLLGVVACGLTAWLAWRNVRAGRGDRRGATRLGVALTLLQVASWVFTMHHVADFGGEIGLLFSGIGIGVGIGVTFGLIYLALEPYARRVAPATLVGWTRLLDGQWADPRVGRDVLVGATTGAAAALVLHVTNGLPTWLPFAGQTTVPNDIDALRGGAGLVTFLQSTFFQTLGASLITFGLFILARMLLRRTWAAGLVVFVVVALIGVGAENFWLELPGLLFAAACWAWLIARHGLLAALAFNFFSGLLGSVPLPLVPGAPYATATWIVFALVLAVIVAASRIAMGAGRPAPRALAQAA